MPSTPPDQHHPSQQQRHPTPARAPLKDQCADDGADREDDVHPGAEANLTSEEAGTDAAAEGTDSTSPARAAFDSAAERASNDRAGGDQGRNRQPAVPYILLIIGFGIVVITAVRLPAVKPDVHAIAPGVNAETEAAGSLRSALPDMRVDINRDPASVLEVLPGIGPKLAQRIADHRVRHGPFRSTADLQRVHGIGPKTVESLEGWLTFSPLADQSQARPPTN